MTLNLNQLEVETFDPSAVVADGGIMPIVSTDQVPNCDGFTAGHC